jgi:cytochrome b561
MSSIRLHSRPGIVLGIALLAGVVLAPSPAAARIDRPRLQLQLAMLDEPGAQSRADQESEEENPDSQSDAEESENSASEDLDFDLLGTPAPPPPDSPEEGRLKLRRQMLTAHQSLGLALLASSLATVIVGQLNYSDRFAGPSTARFERPHAALAYTSLGLFASTGLVGVLAPSPLDKPSQGLDRVTLHKIGVFTAAAGMVAQVVLGLATANREGYLNQRSLAQAHLAVGYATFAALGFGFGALVL